MGKLDVPGATALAALRSIRSQRFSLDRREAFGDLMPGGCRFEYGSTEG